MRLTAIHRRLIPLRLTTVLPFTTVANHGFTFHHRSRPTPQHGYDRDAGEALGVGHLHHHRELAPSASRHFQDHHPHFQWSFAEQCLWSSRTACSRADTLVRAMGVHLASKSYRVTVAIH